MPNETEYPKVVLSIDNQIKRLEERGLSIPNKTEAKTILKNISYFRLQGFWWELQSDKNKHQFTKGNTFSQVVDIYTFDRKLRLLLFDALERIEVSVRTKLIYYPSIELDQWWFEHQKNFFVSKFHSDLLEEIDKELSRTKEVFIETHYQKYGNQKRPPAYKTLEVVSFGCLSKLYSNLNNTIEAKKRIATELNLPNFHFVKSWLMTFNTIRNIIAHHGRLWNRNIEFAPRALHTTDFDFIQIPNKEHSMYHCISAILFVLNKVSPGHSIKEKLLILLDSNNERISEMGFPADWRDQHLWR